MSHLDLRHMEEVDCVLSIHHIFKCSPAVLFDQSLVIKFRKLYKKCLDRVDSYLARCQWYANQAMASANFSL